MKRIELGRRHLAAGDFEGTIASFWTAAREEGSIYACTQLGVSLALPEAGYLQVPADG